MDRDIYLRQPKGYIVKDSRGRELVIKLLKCLYGLKQGPREWYKVLDAQLRELGFRPTADPCLYVFRGEGGVCIIFKHEEA